MKRTSKDVDHHPMELFVRHLLSLQKNGNQKVVSYKVQQDDKGYNVLINVPGAKVEDMTLKIEEGKNGERPSLLLTGVRKVKTQGDDDDDDDDDKSSVEEMNFMRRFTLGDDIDVDHLSAHLEDGVLTVRVPKKQPDELKAPRQIKIVSATMTTKTDTSTADASSSGDESAPNDVNADHKEENIEKKNEEEEIDELGIKESCEPADDTSSEEGSVTATVKSTDAVVVDSSDESVFETKYESSEKNGEEAKDDYQPGSGSKNEYNNDIEEEFDLKRLKLKLANRTTRPGAVAWKIFNMRHIA